MRNVLRDKVMGSLELDFVGTQISDQTTFITRENL